MAQHQLRRRHRHQVLQGCAAHLPACGHRKLVGPLLACYAPCCISCKPWVCLKRKCDDSGGHSCSVASGSMAPSLQMLPPHVGAAWYTLAVHDCGAHCELMALCLVCAVQITHFTGSVPRSHWRWARRQRRHPPSWAPLRAPCLRPHRQPAAAQVRSDA